MDYKKEIEQKMRKLDRLVEEQDKVNAEIEALGTIDKYIEINKIENNILNDIETISFNSPMYEKVHCIRFKLNGEEFKFSIAQSSFETPDMLHERFTENFTKAIQKYLFDPNYKKAEMI